MKIDLRENRAHQVLFIAVPLITLVLGFWFWMRPSTAELEKTAAEKTGEHKEAQKQAELKLSEDRKVFVDAVAAHAQERNAQEARLLELEQRSARQTAELRAQAVRTDAILTQRTQAREVDAVRIASASTPELHARAAALVGEISAPDTTYRAVIALARDREQAHDELAAEKERVAAGEKERALLQQLADERKTALDGEKRHSDQIAGLMRAQQDAFGTSLAELRQKSEAERAAQEKVISRLKGSAFWNSVRTGVKVGAGIGIGVAIGRALN